MGESYKASGVDIEAGDEAVRRIKGYVRNTFNSNVISDLGLFGGFFKADFKEYSEPVLVSSVDGVGTKIKIALLTGKHDTIGQCLVNHCTNDILTGGAKPLFFLDYFATGRLNPDVFEEVIKGFAIACKENGAALIGGETAEMPSLYQGEDYDVSGTIVGIVDNPRIINGSRITKGNILIGLKSSGLHTNGYSLARHVLLKKWETGSYIDELGESIGESLLKIHKSYLSSVYPLAQNGLLNGISHITGGGIIGNTSRLLRPGIELEIDWNSWERLPIFSLIQNAGNIDESEMRKVFNLGIGMILIADESNVDEIIRATAQDSPTIIGRVISS